LKRDLSNYIIERAASGDAEAFREIYFALRSPIYGFAYRMLNDAAKAEDIAQEVFIFFIEHSGKFDPERGSLFAYLCGVARNLVFAHLKKKRNHSETWLEEASEIESNGNGGSPLGLVLHRELSTKIGEKVASLPPIQREVIILRELCDLTYQEIAAVAETDVNTVKARLFRARRSLARELTPYLTSSEEKYHALPRS